MKFWVLVSVTFGGLYMLTGCVAVVLGIIALVGGDAFGLGAVALGLAVGFLGYMRLYVYGGPFASTPGDVTSDGRRTGQEP